MKRSLLKRLGLVAAAALVAAGCTVQPQDANRLNQGNLFTTTGDADTCAAALGNTVATAMGRANQNVTANGVIIGNVALVALPKESQRTPVTGAPTGTGVAPGTAPGLGARTGAATGTGPAAGTGSAAPMNTATATGTAARTNTATATGRAARTVTTAAADPLERVRNACPRLADIRVVNDEGDRARLAEITAAVRSGRPITEFLTELAAMTQRATSAGPGAGGRMQQGSVLPGRTGTPAAPRTRSAPNAPGGSDPARTGPGTPTDPGTGATD